LGPIERDTGYGGSIGGVYGLVVDSFIVGVAVELGIEREIVVVDFVVLVSFDVG
jgi:hypothetical protein